MFAIKTHYDAINSDEVQNWYSGREYKDLCSEGDTPSKYMLNQYGFKTLRAAKISLKAHEKLAEEQNKQSKFWNVSVSIVEF